MHRRLNIEANDSPFHVRQSLRRDRDEAGQWQLDLREQCVIDRIEHLNDDRFTAGERLRADLDRLITVNTQLGNGRDEDESIKQMTTTPKGRTRRTIPMTSTLYDALKALDVVREGYVVRNEDGTAMSDAQTSHATYRICRKAGLPERGWHQLRHAFGTHAARFGVNPWQLMEWMGHKRIDETMGYVHVVERKPRPIPSELVEVGMKETDPTQRVLKQLAARAKFVTNFEDDQQRSSNIVAG